jgi:Coenzyme PQQ synthesis protein D (PqqD)
MLVGLDTIVARNSEISCASIGPSETAMMNVKVGECYSLNAVGSRIWELMEMPKTMAELCTRICEEFEVDAKTCEIAVLKFVGELIELGIVSEDKQALSSQA